VRQAAMRQPDGLLRCLIINCHGIYNGSSRESTGGYGLKLGMGLVLRNVTVFRLLRESHPNSRALVSNIMITACGTARVSPLNSEGEGNGEVFCKWIAKCSGATVTAGTIKQISMPGQEVPYHISDYEGLVKQFAPDGRIPWQHDYGRTFLQGVIHGVN
jgi:hypothetical protein